MEQTLLQAYVHFPEALRKRSVETQLAFVREMEVTMRSSPLPFLVRHLALAQLEAYRKFLQLPAVFLGTQRHFE